MSLLIPLLKMYIRWVLDFMLLITILNSTRNSPKSTPFLLPSTGTNYKGLKFILHDLYLCICTWFRCPSVVIGTMWALHIRGLEDNCRSLVCCSWLPGRLQSLPPISSIEHWDSRLALLHPALVDSRNPNSGPHWCGQHFTHWAVSPDHSPLIYMRIKGWKAARAPFINIVMRLPSRMKTVHTNRS